MQLGETSLLVLGGFGAGLTGSMGGLASLASYPALLAVGIPPIAANVTNSVALMSSTVGTAAGTRPELRGQRRRLIRLSAIAVAGGLGGAVLLLATPSAAFERIVPVLIALGGAVLLLRDPLRRWAGHHSMPAPVLGGLVLVIGVYCGYFGAAAGVLMLAVLSVAATEPFAVTNAVKNIVLGTANLAAVIIYAVVAPVNWAAAALPAACSAAGSARSWSAGSRNARCAWRSRWPPWAWPPTSGGERSTEGRSAGLRGRRPAEKAVPAARGESGPGGARRKRFGRPVQKVVRAARGETV